MWLNIPSTSQAVENPISLETNVIMPVKKSLTTVFDDIIKWPVQPQSKSTRKKEYTPSVITSDKWIEFHKMTANDKLEKEKKKNQLQKKEEKRLKEEKIKRRKLKPTKLVKKVESDTEESTQSNVSWNSKQDSDDESLAEPLRGRDTQMST